MKLGHFVVPRAKQGLRELTELSCDLFCGTALCLHVLEITKGPWWGWLGEFVLFFGGLVINVSPTPPKSSWWAMEMIPR